MHYISPVRLNWYASCSPQTDVVQHRGKSENLFKMVQVLSAIVSECSSYQSVEIWKPLLLIQQVFHHISHQNILLPTHSSLAIRRQSTVQKKRKGKKRINNPTLIVKHFSAVPVSWTSMRQNSNTIFPLITHARISGAINWFWELSSIFNPSSGSVGRVKTSLKTRTRPESSIFKVQAKA